MPIKAQEHKIAQKIARRAKVAWQKGYRDSLERTGEVTFAVSGEIIRLTKTGERIVIGKIEKPKKITRPRSGKVVWKAPTHD